MNRQTCSNFYQKPRRLSNLQNTFPKLNVDRQVHIGYQIDFFNFHEYFSDRSGIQTEFEFLFKHLCNIIIIINPKIGLQNCPLSFSDIFQVCRYLIKTYVYPMLQSYSRYLKHSYLYKPGPPSILVKFQFITIILNRSYTYSSSVDVELSEDLRNKQGGVSSNPGRNIADKNTGWCKLCASYSFIS